MAMATGPMRMNPGTMVFITPNGANIIQEGQAVPSAVLQPPGMVQYVGRQLERPSNQPLQNPQMGLLEKLRKLETKTLGAIQIMMGLIHIGLGGVSVFAYLGPSAGIGGYPFWGGALFIISGSLSVSAENHLKIRLVKCSVGFNIISAMIALIGIVMYLIQFTEEFHYEGDKEILQAVSTGLCALLLLFSMLEFFITVSTAHFGLKMIRRHNEPAPVFIPYTISGGPVVPVEGSLAPPTYDSVVSSLK